MIGIICHLVVSKAWFVAISPKLFPYAPMRIKLGPGAGNSREVDVPLLCALYRKVAGCQCRRADAQLEHNRRLDSDVKYDQIWYCIVVTVNTSVENSSGLPGQAEGDASDVARGRESAKKDAVED